MEQDEHSLNIREIFSLLKKHLLLLLIFSVIFAAAGYVVSRYLTTPQYQSDATMIVNPSSAQETTVTIDQISAAQQLVSTYAVILKSDPMMKQVIKNLNLKMSQGELADCVSVSGVEETEVLDISVTYPNAQQAADIANQITKVAPKFIIKTVKAGSVEVISKAIPHKAPVSPNTKQNVLITALAGLVLAVIIAFAVEILNNKFETCDDIQKNLGTTVLGIIPAISSKEKKPLKQPGLRNRKNKRWGIAAVAVVVVAGVSILCYLHSMQRPVKYVETWKVAESTADSEAKVPTSSSAAKKQKKTGLIVLNADDFYKVQQKDYPIIKVRQKNPNIQNILILGIDGGDPGAAGQNRADCMMVASINRKTNILSVASLLRDTKAYFPNTQSWHKLNAAYSYGGPGLQIDIINYAYKLDIQKYIQVDYAGFQNIINIVNGVPVTLSAREASYSAIKAGKKAGLYILNGAQALGYVRTRKIDNDFFRTQRQRNALQALHNKFRGVSMQQKLAVATECIGNIKTNIPVNELLGSLLSFESGMSNDIRQLEVPSEGDGFYTTEQRPIFYWNLNWSKEDKKLHTFIYGK